MKRFFIVAIMFGFVSVVQAEMPGSSLFKSIPFLNKSDSGKQEQKTDADAANRRNMGSMMNARTPQEFIAAMPSLPTNVCAAGNKERETYLLNVREFVTAVDTEIRRQNREAKKIAKEKEPEIKKNMLAKSGLSEEDVKRLENSKKKKMSKGRKTSPCQQIYAAASWYFHGGSEKFKEDGQEGPRGVGPGLWHHTDGGRSV